MSSLDQGTRWYERRGEGAKGSLAAPKAIEKAISFFRKGIDENPDAFDARWQLIRSLYFRGEYVATELEEKKCFFEEGKTAGEEALEAIRRVAAKDAQKNLDGKSAVELVPYVKGSEPIAQCFLWAGVCWGKWAVAFGKVAAVRQGAAGRIKDFATAVIELSPELDEAGGYRLLGRLHFETPAVPFLTGWASRDLALSNLRKAVEVGPRSMINQMYLAEAIWAFEPRHRHEAKEILEKLLKDPPGAHLFIEELRVQDESRELLKAWRG